MDEKSKSIWKKSWPNLGWLRTWLMVAAAIFLVVLIANLAGGISGWPPALWPELYFWLVGSLLAAPVFMGLWVFIRRFVGWRNFNWLRAWLIVTAATFSIALTAYLAGGVPSGPLSFWPELYFLLTGSLLAAIGFVGLLALLRRFSNWRNFTRLLFGLACFITLITLWYAEEDWRGKHDWEKFQREGEAKGEKFDYAGIIPKPVPDDQNFALVPIWVESIKSTLGPDRARRWYGDKFPDNGRTPFKEQLLLEIWHERRNLKEPGSGDWQRAERTDLNAWQAGYRATNRIIDARFVTNDFPVAPQPQSAAQDVLLALSKHAAAIAELRQASRLTYSRFPLEYDAEDPSTILLPHLAVLKRASQYLQLRAVAELENDQSEPALEDVKLALRLTDSVRTEPILISQLVRIAMLELTIQPVWEGLVEHRWSDKQLVVLDAELAKLDFLADYEFSWRGELGFVPKVLEYRRHVRDTDFFFSEYDNHQDYPVNLEFAAFVFRHCPGGWFYQNQIRYCRFTLQYVLPEIDASRQLAFPASTKLANEARLQEVTPLRPCNFIEHRLLIPPYEFLALGQLAGKFTHAQSSANLARTAIALERYRLAHEEFPESLDALAPEFIAQVPHDVIGGQPLKYRRTSDGQFVLYSVGWNETDDGGVVVNRKNRDPRDESGNATDISQGDWVWRYPPK